MDFGSFLLNILSSFVVSCSGLAWVGGSCCTYQNIEG